MKRAFIPESRLPEASERVRNGERYAEVAKELGVGVTALRAALKRAGLQYVFGRRSKYNKQHKFIMARERQAGEIHALKWDETLASRFGMMTTDNNQRLRWV